jgi:hypothetical protein
MNSRYSLFLLVALIVTCDACGWHRSLEFASRERHERVEIYQPSIDPMLGLRIELVAGSNRSTLLQDGETYIGFAHEYWMKSQPTVGILICGTREVRLAYDTKAGKPVPFGEIEGGLNDDIVQTYGEAPDRHPASMCIGDYYQDQFSQRFPDIRH